MMNKREKTRKNDEKEWKKQWNMMKKAEKTRKHDENRVTTMKNDET